MSDRQSIRPFLTELEAAGDLLRIAKPIDPHFELSAFLSAADAGRLSCSMRSLDRICALPEIC
jgi:UbiD family decarboxylase